MSFPTVATTSGGMMNRSRRSSAGGRSSYSNRSGNSRGEDASEGFSIFDGKRPSRRYSEFVFEGDDEDWDQDEMETDKWADIQEYI